MEQEAKESQHVSGAGVMNSYPSSLSRAVLCSPVGTRHTWLWSTWNATSLNWNMHTRFLRLGLKKFNIKAITLYNFILITFWNDNILTILTPVAIFNRFALIQWIWLTDWTNQRWFGVLETLEFLHTVASVDIVLLVHLSYWVDRFWMHWLYSRNFWAPHQFISIGKYKRGP